MTDPITRLNAALEGRYRIEREIGEGGMATVYLAEDLRHERKVALKVLKPELAAVVGAERFLAEIKTTANLQHPHILPLHDSGETDGFLFFITPFIEGDTLRDKIDREKQLSVEEAIRIASDVAEALDHAHRHGVVHRDIKPANILLTDGRPVIADFGIALAVAQAGGGRVTETGLSVGTPHYMSPEQATGDRDVDPRTDVYALGCVLYEMLVGDPPYQGSTAQAVLAQILTADPISPTSKRVSVPPSVDAAIRKALEKLPADRFSSAQEFAGALGDPGFRHGLESSGLVPTTARGQLTPLAMVLGAVALILAVALIWLRLQAEPARPIERFAVPFLPGQEPTYLGQSGFDLSPDGRMLVYRHDVPEGQVLMVRRWNDLVATPVRETVRGMAPAVSLNGLQLAFSQEDEIRVLDFSGGPVRTLAQGRQPEWGPDGFVYATADSGAIRVAASGGAVEYISRHAEGDEAHFVRDVLPGSRAALLEVSRRAEPSEIRSVDLGSGEMTLIVSGVWPRYLPSGHLVYGAGDGTMMAARFDPRTVELHGTPTALMESLNFWSLADDGKLFYSATGSGATTTSQLSWVTRLGQTTPVDPSWAFQRGTVTGLRWSVSPDGSMVAVRQSIAGEWDIWVKRLDTGPFSRLTFDDAQDMMPVWEPGGQNVTFLSDRNGNFDVWSKSADGIAQAELVLDIEESLEQVDWSPNGEWLLLSTDPGGQLRSPGGILAIRPGLDQDPIPLFVSDFSDVDPAISPNGRWIAYSSNETGRYEVYVTPFPEVNAGRWQVSIDGGRNPIWAHSGRELFFETGGPGSAIMFADVRTESSFVSEPPAVLVDGARWTGSGTAGNLYDLAPDDQRFLISVTSGSFGPASDGETDARPSVILVQNFFEELRQVVPDN